MIKRSLAIIAVCLLVALSYAYAAPTGGQTTQGAQETGTASTSQTATAAAGNVSQVNVSGTVITSRWAGFYGEVSGSLLLANAAQDSFYTWTVSNLTDAVVYATNTTVADWSNSNIIAMNYSALPLDNNIDINGSNTDNWTNTMNNTGAFSSSSLSAAGARYAITNGDSFETYSLQSVADDAAIWAGVVIDDGDSFQSGTNTTDYQILVPSGASTTYNFYLELP